VSNRVTLGVRSGTIRVTSHLSIERRLDSESPWTEHMRLPDDTSVEYGRILMSRLEPVLPTAEHRLVYTRVETMREVLAP
jgi:hypothetical protein